MQAIEAFLKLGALTNDFEDFDSMCWKTLSRMAGAQHSEASGGGASSTSNLGIQFKKVVASVLALGTASDPRKYEIDWGHGRSGSGGGSGEKDGSGKGGANGGGDDDGGVRGGRLRPDNLYRIAKLAANAMQLVETTATRAQVTASSRPEWIGTVHTTTAALHCTALHCTALHCTALHPRMT